MSTTEDPGSQEKDVLGDVYFDADTMRKVYDAMELAGIPSEQAIIAVMRMQNVGILFRERGRM